LNVINSLLPFVPGFSSRCQCAVVDQSHTAQCLTQETFLLGGWVEAVTESFFHALHCSNYSVSYVNCVAILGVLNPTQLPLLSLPRSEAGGLSENFR
jgi:hypothetical protein